MPLIPITPPPGVKDAGTDLESAGRWLDASLVRWREGVLRPVGGWRERVASVTTNPARALLAWQDNSGDRWTAAGDASTLKIIAGDGTVSTITPAGLTGGVADASVNTGYGGGFYGVGTYGTPRATTGTFSEATTWSLDTWGEDLVACSVADGGLYQWDASVGVGTAAAAISNAPTDCAALVVTEERFLMALGASGDPRLVKWSDQEDNTTWTAAATNQAGDFVLQTPGQIMCGARLRGATLILTDMDAHTATYQGPPFVYGFERVGSACGIIARKALAVTDAGAFWMGPQGFFRSDGQAVQPVPCEVHDKVFKDINRTQQSKCWAMAMNQFNEVWFFYPSADSDEIDRYVSFDYAQGIWSCGELARTAGFPRGVFLYPNLAGSDLGVYEHEVGHNYGGADVYAETGPLMNGQGDRMMMATNLYPDEEAQGDVSVTFKTRFYANEAETSHGPYTPDGPTNVRFTGRQVRMRVTGSELSDWTVGNMRLDVVQRGRR